MICVLCTSHNVRSILLADGRSAIKCRECELVFAETFTHLSAEEELLRYKLHNNTADDPHYVSFLSQLLVPVANLVPPPHEILDFGSGPVPVLAGLFSGQGYVVSTYDLYFSPDDSVLKSSYSAVISSETVEHFRDPLKEWSIMAKCVKSGGIIGVMTLLHSDSTDFSTWWYTRDPTHIAFYSERTMLQIAEFLDLSILNLGKRVIIFQKK